MITLVFVIFLLLIGGFFIAVGTSKDGVGASFWGALILIVGVWVLTTHVIHHKEVEKGTGYYWVNGSDIGFYRGCVKCDTNVPIYVKEEFIRKQMNDNFRKRQ